MTDERKEMERALKEVVIPELRRRGFKGSMPHFRRVRPDRVNFLTFQFYSAGGSFVVVIASCGPNGVEDQFFSHIPIEKLTAHDCHGPRRLGSRPEEHKSDHWFHYGPRSYDSPRPPKPYSHYLDIANSIVQLLDSQAEKWWSEPLVVNR